MPEGLPLDFPGISARVRRFLGSARPPRPHNVLINGISGIIRIRCTTEKRFIWGTMRHFLPMPDRTYDYISESVSTGYANSGTGALPVAHRFSTVSQAMTWHMKPISAAKRSARKWLTQSHLATDAARNQNWYRLCFY